ncbi:NAD-dependent succinate-semialdehyde dehydrogenase [Pseudomonas panipatensis]|uniref:Succinate-semialdehyde dehydrogenase n=1 Tax=Pseudomonas panipatensis TaxID=428992 RepID=A0A1G8L465_9PSED|nr:NAD-dependent succinate-semialdehyde dehydrogenase [Pseudomonas panipatensis]SDI49970.1 succinate-semialdehyde dehydrogenase [Pseudomonas panipatensis]SMP72628.1 succinate semialdehyde dehydrogenase [Pseudomonas panipatensis]
MNQIAAISAAISRSPATGQELARYPFQDAEQLEAVLASADRGFRQWRDTPLSERVAVLRKMAEVLRARVEPMARMEAEEMGMPVSQARGEINKCANLCEWYAEHGPAMLDDEPTSVEGAYIAYLPLGPVLAVMPWNFPTWQVMRGAVSIILGGNTYVLKHAPNVMGCAYQLQQAWRDAGLPEGVFEVLNVEPPLVSKAIADERIASIAVTGSVGAGAAIASQAGAALKKCVLELGGSDPFIVLADADLDAAVKAAVASRFSNCGQVCIAAKRMILEAPIAEAFTEKLLAAVKALKIGDPLADDTFVGPMARADLREELHQQVQKTIAEGATLLLGGHMLEGAGNYYAPTVLGNVQPGMTSYRQEIFGPVASLIVARDAEHAIEIANDSEFGLAGALWSADREKAKQLARRIVSGGVFINGFSASDPRVPIGGVKKSGFGRELSHFGVREFLNAQTVWIDRR